MSPMDGFEKIGVLGAGMMGAEIALSFAMAGTTVIIKDASLDLAEKGKERLHSVLDRAVKKGRFGQESVHETLARIIPADRVADMQDAGLVVEAVFESFEVKKTVLEEIDGICNPDCLFISNTSSIPITQLASCVAVKRRAFFLGAHFFSPASVMRLVEVIPGLETDEKAVSQTMSVLSNIGKTPIRVKDVPGFAVNRILHVMLIEANRLVEEGVVSPDDVDTACKLGLGHPIGPHALMDLAGNDLCLRVQEILFEAYGERFKPQPILKQRVFANRLGRKTGKGWFSYDTR